MMHVLPMLLEYTLQFLTHLIRAPTQELTDDVVAPAKEDAMANDESVPAPDMPKEVSDAANAAAPDAAEILKEASDAANAAAPAPAAEVSLDATEIGVFASLSLQITSNHFLCSDSGVFQSASRILRLRLPMLRPPFRKPALTKRPPPPRPRPPTLRLPPRSSRSSAQRKRSSKRLSPHPLLPALPLR